MIVIPNIGKPPIIIPTPTPVPHTSAHTETGTEYVPIQEPTKGEKIFTITSITILIVLIVWLIIEIIRDSIY